MNAEQLRELVLILLVFDCADRFGEGMYSCDQPNIREIYYLCCQAILAGIIVCMDDRMLALVQNVIDVIFPERVQNQIAGILGIIPERVENQNNVIEDVVEQRMGNLLLNQQPGQILENMLNDLRWLENQEQDEELDNPAERVVDQGVHWEQNPAVAGMEEPIPDPEGGGGGE
ncbi:hypothetical protein EDL79_04075 [Ehrlichia ruminantium]|uniref:Uncharacterized protein n=1 Tax=Ehrlichia ruminantium TaxID=779 RepID=A0AAE6Q9B4_EHRRU|nr:hypothetical protein [Ehrlichia ruminantium]QGR02792.1 hypothetical protein EDL81_04065 [Ehrlichia ruminantium]QGR03714.1 hypothetical protein EDL80_04065 [Ehrlichia ruminantium]QGR04641.1 hypothetical protein EDL79_04075 [Ehrlichia ruminantium]